MNRVLIPGTDISTSRFIFGTASLFSVGTSRDRQKLLHLAVDKGFSHFDTAPYYGFGMAERDLAPLLARHREVTVTTKVGIYSPGGELQFGPTIFLRKASGKIIRALSRPIIDWSVSRAQKSLEGSLKRLGRERIDLFLLHEPVAHLLDTREWLGWLQAKVKEGLVGRFGLAISGAERLEPFLSDAPELTDVVQTFDSLKNNEANILTRYGRPLQITYGYVSAAKAHGSKSFVTKILRGALRRNPEGAIIVSTRKLERISQYAQMLNEMSP